MRIGITILLSLFLCYSCTISNKLASHANNVPTTGMHEENASLIMDGHDGSTYDKAIIMKEKSENEGVKAEYTWIRQHYPGYMMKQQAMNFHKGKAYDILDIVTSEGTEKSIYFDISNFYGKL